MAQQMTMFSKAATANFTAVRPSKAQRNSAVVVRAGAYDEELVQTAVRTFCILFTPAIVVEASLMMPMPW